MAELREVFVGQGCSEVTTYIQSGNVVFSSKVTDASKLEKQLAAAIAKEFGFEVPTLVRTREELAAAIAGNPYATGMADLKTLHLLFLERRPSHEVLQRIDSSYGRPDEFAIAGTHVYLKIGAGVATTKLTNAYFDSRLRMVTTARNWRTVLHLFELLGESKAWTC
jgi:uncharacterized protein (DUF1697 family)